MKLSNLSTSRLEFFSLGFLIIYLKHSVICIFNENTDEYNVKITENNSSIAILTWERLINPEILFSREGDNASGVRAHYSGNLPTEFAF